MENLAEVVKLTATALGLVVTGLVIIDWSRHRDANRFYRATSMTLLAVVNVLARLDEAFGFQYRALFHGRVIAYLLMAYSLLLFRHSFIPVSRRLLGLAATSIGITAIATVAFALPPEAPRVYTARQLIALALIVVVTGACILEPAWRFWRASRNRPFVQKARLRSIAAAYSGIIAVLVLIAVSGPLTMNPRRALLVHSLSLVLALLLYAALVTPSWLKRIWMRREESSFAVATKDLLEFSPDRPTLAGRALDSAIRLVGAEGGFVAGPAGLLAGTNVSAEFADRVKDVVDDRSGVHQIEGSTVAVAVLIESERGPYLLVTISGPFTPVFGSEEVVRLMEYGAAFGLAMRRVELSEQVTQQTERLESLLSALSDSGTGFLITENGRVEYANDAYCRLTGYTLDELRSMDSIIDLAPDDVRPVIIDRFKRRAGGEDVPDHYESALMTRDGRRIDVEVALKVTQFKPVLQIISVIHDVTSRKEALRNMEFAYEREKEGVRRLMELDEMKSDFLATVSHELRTPLTAISGFAKTVIGRWSDIPESQKLEFLERIDAHAGELESLISDLLDFTRLESGHLKFEIAELPLGRQVIETLSSLGSSMRHHAVRMEVDPETRVLADEGALRRVLGNLVANAVKFSPSGSEIAIVAKSMGGERVAVSVIDAGPGVAQEERAKIFERFYRIRRGNSAGPGTGIGLAIVKEFTEAMGGKVWVEANPEGGSIFSFSLPSASTITTGRSAEPALKSY